MLFHDRASFYGLPRVLSNTSFILSRIEDQGRAACTPPDYTRNAPTPLRDPQRDKPTADRPAP